MTKTLNLSLWVAALICGSSFITGCGSSPAAHVSTPAVSSPAESKEISPLHIGNTYIMKRTFYNWNDGQLYSTQLDTTRIVDTEHVNDQIYYVTNTRQIMINREDGFWSATASGTDMMHEAKYPGEVGDKVFAYKKITAETPPDTVTGYWEIIATNDSVTVPFGTFHCYKYRMDGIGTSGRLHIRTVAWWSPTYGRIKTENYYPNPNSKLILVGTSELVKAELK